MSDFNEQLARMKSLMNYGKVNEETNTPKNYTLEYHATAADGKTYGIIRECNKYYIKQAETGKELVAESYSYLGGFNNKKNYEYFSYANALKQFELKMASINEACEGNVNISTLDPFRSNAIIAEGTENMKNEIARQRQIMYNASMLMNESTGIGEAPFKTQPEAEKANSGDKDAPFVKDVKPDMEFDGEKESCPKCVGEPFGEDSKTSDKEKSVQVDNSVAGMKPKGGKVVRVNESLEDGEPEDTEDDDFEFTPNDEDDDDMFNDGDYVDSEESDENDVEAADDEEGDNEFELEDDVEGEEPTDEFEDSEEVDETDPDSVRSEIERLQSILDNLENNEDDAEDMEDVEGDAEDTEDVEGDAEDTEDVEGDAEDMEDVEGDTEDMEDVEEGTENLEDVEGDSEDIEGDELEELSESKKKYMNRIVESVVADLLKEEELHSFGDHPGYRKEPMDLPETGEDKNEHGEDINDESVHSEEPFGSQKGNSAPFEKEVERITDKILQQIKEGKVSFIKKK